MELLKLIHIGSAFLSIIGFVVRSLFVVNDSSLIKHRLVKTIPHIVDTVFLASGITLAVNYSISPLDHSWLLAKIIALLVYIAFGFIGLDLKVKKTLRMTACVAAITTFAYIAAVAIVKDPLLGLF